MLTSSFLAHHRLGRELPEAGGDRVVEAFSLQSKQLVGPIVGIINRVITKRDPIIIEGVNMLATYLFEEIPNDPKNAVFFMPGIHLTQVTPTSCSWAHSVLASQSATIERYGVGSTAMACCTRRGRRACPDCVICAD